MTKRKIYMFGPDPGATGISAAETNKQSGFRYHLRGTENWR